MKLATDLYDPAELTGFTRAAVEDLPVNQFKLAEWLPNQEIADLQFRFTQGGEGLQDAAVFRAYDTEAEIGNRPGFTRVSGELPPISRKYRLGEYDNLRMRANSDTFVAAEIEKDAKRGAKAISSRLELARAEAVRKGKLVIAENGVSATVDFGRASNQTTNTGTSWATVATATVLTDLRTWSDRVAAASGVAPTVALCPIEVIRYAQRNKEVIDAVVGATVGRTRVTIDELNALLESEGLPRIERYDAQVKVNGAAQKLIPADEIVLLPDAGDDDFGATLLGVTAEALEAGYGLEASEQPGIVAGTYRTEDPVGVWTKVAAIGLPILANPNMTLGAKVVL